MGKKTPTKMPFAVLAMVLAWLVPGAGHVYLGRPIRGIIICLTIAATFWGGVAMGGVMTIDPVGDRWWFIAGMFTGVHGLVSWQIQQRVWNRIWNDPDVTAQRYSSTREGGDVLAEVDKKLHEENLALTSPTDTVARAYSGIAGLLNLMCIFDAMMLSLMGLYGEPVVKVAAAAAGKGGG